MDERKKLILEIIIKEHIATGQPVASSTVVEKYRIPVSSATVRNEMAELEADGWIAQPYTSAGRIPTEKAYKHYISEITETPLPKKETEILKEASADAKAKQIAKQLAQMTGLTVVWASDKDNVYVTGVSNLLNEPELDLGMIDDLDEIVAELFDDVSFAPEILIGHSSPFGNYSGAIVARYGNESNAGLIGLVGPMHMDYEANRQRLKLLTELLSE